MEILNSGKIIEPTSVALGYFDGIHKGHLAVIEKTIEAKKNGLKSVVCTFDQNPKTYFNRQVPSIISKEQKDEILKKIGIDSVYYMPFKKIVNIEANDFIDKILIDKLNAKEISCGFNFYFANGGKNSALDLKDICENKGIKVNILPPVLVNDENVSSTKIRDFISKGEIAKAISFIGRDFEYFLEPVDSKKYKSSINKPDITQIITRGLIIPRLGLYSSAIRIDDKLHLAKTNIRKIIDFDQELFIADTWIMNCLNKKVDKEKVHLILFDFLKEKYYC